MKYYLGLDNGGTSTKAALFDGKGNQIAVESLATRAITPAPGFTERDMQDMWQDNCTVIRNLLDKSGIDPADISAIGLCGHGKGLYLWGKNGQPVRRGILSSDNRALRYAETWKDDGTEEEAFTYSAQHIMACQPVCLLAWLRDNEPGTLEATRWVFECKDYIRFRLTGEARAEITDYSGTGMMNLHTGRFDKDLLALFGLESIYPALPPICQSAEIAGYVTPEAATLTGLVPGTPVAGGMFDIDACALAVNVLDERDICVIAGTWSINEYPRSTPILDGSVAMNSFFCLPGQYLIEESSPTSAGNNEWFIRQLLPELRAEAEARGESIYEVMNSWAEEFVPADRVPLFFPFLSAGNADVNAKAAFIGLDMSHTRHHMLRAVYEGICFSHRWHLDRLLRSREGHGGTVHLAGGAAHSEIWTQMFADVLNFPVQTVSAGETGALGCAIAAAAAIGDYPDVAAAAQNMVQTGPTVMPDAEAAVIYEKKYSLYLRALESLRGFWAEWQNISED